MSRRNRHGKRSQLRNAKQALAGDYARVEIHPHEPEHGELADPRAGVYSLKLLLGVGPDGKKFPRSPSWEWLPRGRSPCIQVRGDGYHTAHTGNCAESTREEPLERYMRGAGLSEAEREAVRALPPHELVDYLGKDIIRRSGITGEELSVMRLQALGERRSSIATQLGLTWRQVKHRLETAATKLRGYSEALALLDGPVVTEAA